jgi:hypothetical protein
MRRLYEKGTGEPLPGAWLLASNNSEHCVLIHDGDGVTNGMNY